MAYLCVLFVMHFEECIDIKRPLYTYWIICKADVQIKYIKITHVTVTLPMYFFIVQRIYTIPEICRTLFC